jgi:hypothetical protein
METFASFVNILVNGNKMKTDRTLRVGGEEIAAYFKDLSQNVYPERYWENHENETHT